MENKPCVRCTVYRNYFVIEVVDPDSPDFYPNDAGKGRYGCQVFDTGKNLGLSTEAAAALRSSMYYRPGAVHTRMDDTVLMNREHAPQPSGTEKEPVHRFMWMGENLKLIRVQDLSHYFPIILKPERFVPIGPKTSDRGCEAVHQRLAAIDWFFSDARWSVLT